MQKITNMLMFEGNAGAAMNFYTSLFDDAQIINATYEEDGKSVKHATFSLCGREFVCIDSSVSHGFAFTPSISMVVNCESEEEVDDLYGKLSDGGKVMMPLGAYPFSKKFAWVSDRFGVSWQLMLG